MRDGHRLRLRNEEKAGKSEYTTPAAYARTKDAKELVDLINKTSGLESIKSTVDPEWFSDMHPDNAKKPGPKKKSPC